MKVLKIIFFLSVSFVFFNCNTSTKKETSSVNKPKKKDIKTVIPIEKKWDSLNKNNVTVFFTEYAKQHKETRVLIETDYGNIKIRLYNNTPIHKANFIFLTKIGYFNSTVFYRVAKNFVIQGGNSDNVFTMKQRFKYGNYLLKPEFRNNRKHKYGAVAAAREWENNPNKLSSPFEFYIVQKRNGAHHLNNLHTVFGEVYQGFSTMTKIANVKVDDTEWPIVDIKMKVSIIE